MTLRAFGKKVNNFITHSHNYQIMMRWNCNWLKLLEVFVNAPMAFLFWDRFREERNCCCFISSFLSCGQMFHASECFLAAHTSRFDATVKRLCHPPCYLHFDFDDPSVMLMSVLWSHVCFITCKWKTDWLLCYNCLNTNQFPKMLALILSVVSNT